MIFYDYRLLNFDKKETQGSPGSMAKVLGEGSNFLGDSIVAGGLINALSPFWLK